MPRRWFAVVAGLLAIVVFIIVFYSTRYISLGSIIAAGTVIPENTVIEPYSLWMGVPGKFKKRIEDETSQQMILQYAKNYFDYTQQYRKEFPSKY